MAQSEIVAASSDDDVDFGSIPATALNITSRMTLSKYLNPEMQLMSSANYARDFRGLAEQMDFDYMDIKNFQCKSDPTAAVLDSWVRRPKVTIQDLLDMLKNMDRYDVIEDGLQHFKNDANSYRRRKKSMNENPIQVPEVTSCRTFESLFNVTEPPKLITVDDVYGEVGVSQYDAYVCYAEDDVCFVYELAKYLEAPGVNLKLCIKGRDILLGNIKFDAYVRLIETRCKVLLIILTPEFLASRECEFQMNYAAGLAVEQRQRKLIPIILRQCEIPLILKFLTKLDFTRAAIHDWMWNKLVASIRGVQASFYVGAPSNGFAPAITGSSASSQALPGPSRSPPMISGSSVSPPMLSYSSSTHPFFSGSLPSPFPALAYSTPSAHMGNLPPSLSTGSLSTSPQPVITFPPTQSYQPISPDAVPPSVAPAVCGPVTISATAVPAPSQTLAPPQVATTPKHTPPVKQKWFRNIKERFSSISSTSNSSSSSASSATSGFHSQSGTALESSEIPDNETSM